MQQNKKLKQQNKDSWQPLSEYTLKKTSDETYLIYKDPNKVYLVDLSIHYCQCPAWYYSNKEPKTCKHLEFVKNMLNQQNAL
jgi:hypothetical protein